MRFLCLHGSGTGGSILNIQLSSLIQKVQSKGHTFHFWDGPLPSKAGPGVAPFFDPPYYSWYGTDPTEAEIRAAAESLLKKLRVLATPYDAVIGFSQGTALLATLVLMCKNEHPDEPLPFKGAMFFSGGVPFTILRNYMPISEKAVEIVTKTKKGLDDSSVAQAKKIEMMMETGKRVDLWDHPNPLWDGKEQVVRDQWTLPELDERDVFGLDMWNLPEAARLDIPAAVIYGHKDPMAQFHVQLAMLCDPEKRITYDHRGGHEIPRTTKVVEDLAKAMDWLGEKIKAGR